jgi:hypothetical protein
MASTTFEKSRCGYHSDAAEPNGPSAIDPDETLMTNNPNELTTENSVLMLIEMGKGPAITTAIFAAPGIESDLAYWV